MHQSKFKPNQLDGGMLKYINVTYDNLWNFHVVTLQITKSMLRLTKVILHN